MGNKPVSDKYVVLQNTSTSPKVITDHRGTLQQMKRGEYCKIFIESGDGEQLAFRKYVSMKKIPGLIVTFSANVEVAPHIDKLTVRSNKGIDEETAKRVDAVRKSVQLDAKAKNMGAAHLKRVKAEQALKATGVNVTLREKEVEPDLEEEIEDIPKPAAKVKAAAPKREAKASAKKPKEEEPEEETGLTADVEELLEAEDNIPEEETAGIALTEENLSSMTKVAVIDVAKQLEMDIDESVDKKDIIKAILKKVA
jgi:hypothetical protein